MQMRVEKRDNSVHIDGYVNAVERESKTLRDSNGMPFNEMIMAGTFQRAIDSADKIDLMVDHERIIGNTKTNLSLYEDAIGLRASLDTDDPEVVEGVDNLKGWSFGFRDAKATIEPRSGKPALRMVTDLILDEVSLIVNKSPAYAGTLAECRDDTCTIQETRSYMINDLEVIDKVTQFVHSDGSVETTTNHKEETSTTIYGEMGDIDYTPYEDRIRSLIKEGKK